jgi:ABC-type dipeptide/oligopeptide/nickel transport system permease component
VITARSKGMGEWRVAGLHAMKNALPPVLTYLGAQMGYLFGGAVVVESIFLWPGLANSLHKQRAALSHLIAKSPILRVKYYE